MAHENATTITAALLRAKSSWTAMLLAAACPEGDRMVLLISNANLSSRSRSSLQLIFLNGH
ncbi:hypothetical protein ACI7BZ_11695 [Xanthobacter sp. AM11]|uniref:hypothetical protein n=1 Tax=Xanthobacter sp. AM11 TaxID=3380643 RepID=UPI0039BF9970